METTELRATTTALLNQYYNAKWKVLVLSDKWDSQSEERLEKQVEDWRNDIDILITDIEREWEQKNASYDLFTFLKILDWGGINKNDISLSLEGRTLLVRASLFENIKEAIEQGKAFASLDWKKDTRDTEIRLKKDGGQEWTIYKLV